MWFTNKNQIIDWESGYYPNINDATPAQQRCYLDIKSRIEKGEYVDVGNNDSYLYAYRYDLNSRIVNANSPDGWRGLLALYNNFIKLYEDTKPKVVSYFYPWMIISSVLLNNDIRGDVERFINFSIKNNLSGYADFMASMFVTSHQISSRDHVDEKYFRAFVGLDLRQFLTQTGKKNYSQVMQEVFSLLRADFEHSKTNYIFKLYDFVDGVLPVDNLDYLQSQNKADYQQPIFNESKITLRVMHPEYNDRRRISYVKHVMYEAENIFRERKGLQKIGEGWISETLLFRQMEAAFAGVEVKQHASPGFLGRQHYDVYLPKYKIALEYQGAQHHRPVEFFGGQEAYERNVKRDENKKNLSAKNGVAQIDVMPDYELKDIIGQIATTIFGANHKDIKTIITVATRRAEKISIKETIEAVDPEAHTKAATKIAKKHEDSEVDDFKISLRIKKLVAARRKSPYAGDDGLNIPNDVFDKMLEKLNEVKEVGKTDPEKSNELAKQLFDSGYRAPAIYERMAINYRKLGDHKAEADLLIQMKRDFNYNFDDRIKKVLRLLGDDYEQ